MVYIGHHIYIYIGYIGPIQGLYKFMSFFIYIYIERELINWVV